VDAEARSRCMRGALRRTQSADSGLAEGLGCRRIAPASRVRIRAFTL